MKIGLLGGTFDPIHNGHLKLARAALAQLKLARIFFVLTPRSPFKQGKTITPFSLRKKMVALAIQGDPKMRLGLWEKTIKGPSYSEASIRFFRRNHPRHEIFFIMGSDLLKDFHRWRKADQITQMATLVVGRRPGNKRISIPKGYGSKVVSLKGRFPELSSTDIREDLKGEKGRMSGLPENVRAFIKKRRLYGDSILS